MVIYNFDIIKGIRLLCVWNKMKNIKRDSIVIRLSHRQRWGIYSFKDIHAILHRLVIMFDHSYFGYERRLISTLWYILGKIVYINASIDPYSVQYLWYGYDDQTNTAIYYSINNTVYFLSNPTKKEYTIDKIRSAIDILVPYTKPYIEDYKENNIKMFHAYSTIRGNNMTLDGLI